MANNQNLEEQTKTTRRLVMRIDVLPDHVLLEIFYFHVEFRRYESHDSYYFKPATEIWQLLAHVSRRWRNLVFGSSRRLNLRLCCTPRTPVIDTLDVWPAFPLIIWGNMDSSDTDNVVAALGQNNRVCEVDLYDLVDWQLDNLLAAMHVPFPELTNLLLRSISQPLSAIPDSFLGGSAPCLQYLLLHGIAFRGLPKLLLSANHLVLLFLIDIPHSGYISPLAIVTVISGLSSLEALFLGFRDPQSRPDWQSRSMPPPIRSTLPLKTLYFKGVTEYLEELVIRIDTPQLSRMEITFLNQIDYHCPGLVQFINCTPTLKAIDDRAEVEFGDSIINLRYRTSPPPKFGTTDHLTIAISCREPDWQLSSVEQVCNFSLHSLSTFEYLDITNRYSEVVWKNDAIEDTLWLEVLLPFTAVKYLRLSKIFFPGIAGALTELVGDRITEVLPSLQDIAVEGLEESGPVPENIRQFITARQFSGHPITITPWKGYKLRSIFPV